MKKVYTDTQCSEFLSGRKGTEFPSGRENLTKFNRRQAEILRALGSSRRAGNLKISKRRGT